MWPRCRDAHTTYFEGVSTPPDDQFTRKEIQDIEREKHKENEQQYAERQAEKFDRMARYSLDKDNKRIYEQRADKWKEVAKETGSGIIKLSDAEQYALNQYLSFESYGINEKLRSGLELNDMEEKMLNNLDSALEKFPRYEGYLSRSLYFGNRQSVEECISGFKIGEPVCFKEFISTTSSERLYNPDGEIQIFISNSKRGRNLSELNIKEAEILYERGSEFRVINVINCEGKYHVILEET